MQAKRQPQTFIEDTEFLSHQLIRLGDMIGIECTEGKISTPAFSINIEISEWTS